MSPSTVESCPSVGFFLKQSRMRLSPQSISIGSHRRLQVRIGRAVTQEEIAEAIGVSRVWYATIESGRGDVSPRLLPRIADALMLNPKDRLALLRLIFQAFADLPESEAS